MSAPLHGHDPVLLAKTVNLLDPQPGQTAVDCTVGRAGHASTIASRLGSEGTLICLDVDQANLEFSHSRLQGCAPRVRLFHANFSELADVLSASGVPAANCILADLGLSTNQLFDSRYGLSFAIDMPLDMRIDPRLSISAAEIVNRTPEKELANVLYELAQERYSRQIAGKLAQARRTSPITSTERLAELVRSAIPHPPRLRGRGAREKIDPATHEALGPCPACHKGQVYVLDRAYACENAVASPKTCTFRIGKIILQREIPREQVQKLITTGKTDLLHKFISKKGRPFSAYLKLENDKVGFEFAPRAAKAKKSTAKKPPASEPAAA
jgi:hypothetical protein